MKSSEAKRSPQQKSRVVARFRRLSMALIAAVVLGAGLILFSGWANAKRIDAFRSNGQQGGRDEIRIELSNNGFTPSEVQHAPGSFAIAVENNTLSTEYKLVLKAEDGTVLSEVQIQKGSSAWTVNLQTGKYTLTEINHQQWVCHVVVQ
jgi:hypothetical protein